MDNRIMQHAEKQGIKVIGEWNFEEVKAQYPSYARFTLLMIKVAAELYGEEHPEGLLPESGPMTNMAFAYMVHIDTALRTGDIKKAKQLLIEINERTMQIAIDAQIEEAIEDGIVTDGPELKKQIREMVVLTRYHARRLVRETALRYFG